MSCVMRKPTRCHCPPDRCSAPKPTWCIGRRALVKVGQDVQLGENTPALPYTLLAVIGEKAWIEGRGNYAHEDHIVDLGRVFPWKERKDG